MSLLCSHHGGKKVGSSATDRKPLNSLPVLGEALQHREVRHCASGMKQISKMEEKPFTSSLNICPETWAGIFKQSMRARNRVGIGLSYWPARLNSLAESVPWNQFLSSLKVLKIRALFLLRRNRTKQALAVPLFTKLCNSFR